MRRCYSKDQEVVVAVHQVHRARYPHAYDAANLAIELYNSAQAVNGRDSFGNGNKFITPMIVNGRVCVGTPTGVAVRPPRRALRAHESPGNPLTRRLAARTETGSSPTAKRARGCV
jgi:hypothetical protein